MINAAIHDIDALTPETALMCRAFLTQSKAAGLNVKVVETRRSFNRQASLYAMGRTQPGRVVTYSKAGTGKHEDGTAFDIAFEGVNPYPSDVRLWARLGSIGKACGLTWGGEFKGVDSVHFENNKVRSIMIDDETMAKAQASVEQIAVKPSKLPTLKSAAAGAAVTAVIALLPTIAIFFPAISPFVGAINAVAKLFGYGV